MSGQVFRRVVVSLTELFEGSDQSVYKRVARQGKLIKLVGQVMGSLSGARRKWASGMGWRGVVWKWRRSLGMFEGRVLPWRSPVGVPGREAKRDFLLTAEQKLSLCS